MESLITRFRTADRKGLKILHNLRTFFHGETHLYREASFSRRSGGRTPDRRGECMIYEQYSVGPEGSWNEGALHFYFLCDATGVERMHFFSVLIDVPPESLFLAELLKTLDDADFVADHSQLAAARPPGKHSFTTFLEAAPRVEEAFQWLFKVFHIQETALVA